MPENIDRWLEQLGLGEFAAAFVENRIDAETLRELTADDLKELGVAALGDRKKLLKAIAGLGSEPASTPTATKTPPPGQAERRQLTVMFCDLVGSTELSQRLDPEDLRLLMRRYQDAVAGAVSRYGGHVAKYLGDGVLAYFGWPQAYEDQAERAIRAGLDASLSVDDIRLDEVGTLRARVGIASGQVIVGDLIGAAGAEMQAVTGETPNLAARLQGVAEPGQVVIGAMTRRLVGDTFELNSLGSRELKGFSDPVAVWSVAGEGTAESRFEAAHLVAPTQLIGRQHELGLLRERWELAKRGEGQVVLLSAEAGIGKSRMVQALRDEVAGEHHFRLRFQCTPHHTNSAFYPVVRRLERAAGISADDDTESKLDKLEGLLRASDQEIEPIAPFFASLILVPGEERYGPLDLTPQQLRAQTISVLIEQVLALSEIRPVLYILEDAHWIDPTTEALVGETISRVQQAGILMVITHRPEYAAPFLDHPHLTTVALNRLSRAQSVEMVRELAGDGLPDAAIDHIGGQADGVPLFVEELTKTVLEAGAAGAGAAAQSAIPTTLQASLIARLDHLGTAKNIAQVGAVIGREFSHQLIVAMAPVEATALNDALQVLVSSGLVFRRGAAPEITYSFKHALIRDVAYEELLRDRRQQLHERVARSLEADFPAIVEAEPELVAHHLSEAGQFADAIDYWHRAGRQSLHRSAYMEADAHLNRGIVLLQELEGSPQRDRREIGLCLDIGAVQMTQGPGSPENSEAYERALALCEQFQEGSEHFTALWGLWMVNTFRAEYDKAKGLSDELLSLAPKLRESDFFLQAGHAAWTTNFTRGELLATAKHTDDGRDIYDRQAHASHAFSYGGHDPGVCCNAISALTYWLLGYPDKSLTAAHAAIDLAEEIQIPFSSCQASVYGAFAYQFRGEEREVEKHGNKGVAMASENGFPHWLGWGFVATCWAHVRQGRHEKEIENMQQSLEDLRAAGHDLLRPYLLSLLADACGQLGEPEKGLAVALGALKMAQHTGERWWQAELHRQEGEFRLLVDDGDTVAETCFATAIELAQRQSAKSLELRAATSLARHWQAAGKRVKAHDLLYPIYGWFTEGFDTADLLAAKRVLHELA